MGEGGEAVVDRNLSLSQGAKRVQPGTHVHPVAVCGGGPSLGEYLNELKAWPGDIWAINHTAEYLMEHGIDCARFSVDPVLAPSSKVKRAIQATCCIPQEGAEVFDLIEHAPDGVPGGPTSATRAPALALRLGYPAVVFFGCESSFAHNDHVDRNEACARGDQLIVRVGGQDYRTYPEFLLQAECLSMLIRDYPVFTERSGGLLRAMAQNPDWEVIAVSSSLRTHLLGMNGHDFFQGTYLWAPST